MISQLFHLLDCIWLNYAISLAYSDMTVYTPQKLNWFTCSTTINITFDIQSKILNICVLQKQFLEETGQQWISFLPSSASWRSIMTLSAFTRHLWTSSKLTTTRKLITLLSNSNDKFKIQVQ